MTNRKKAFDSHLYDHPPIADSLQDRVANAKEYLLGERQWSQVEAAKKAGITRAMLQRAIDGKNVGFPGRKRLISKEGIAELREETTKACLELNACTSWDLKKVCQRKLLTERGCNSLVPIEQATISDRTVKKYMVEGQLVEQSGKYKNNHRTEQYLNIRNAIACAAMLTSLERKIDFEMFHSEDDVTMFFNATRQVHEWACSKGFNIVWAKYAGGCSMSQSPNDLGVQHKLMHQQFASSNYRYNDVCDPPGKPYADLKEYLSKYLEASSFKTLWKCFCKAEEFISRAFSTANIISSFKVGGVYPRCNRTVLSHNQEFCKQSEKEAQYVLATIEPFSLCIDAKGYIHEDEFDQQFQEEENIDTLPRKTGMPLNEMATNRQRAMIDSHDGWLAELKERDELKRQQAEEKAKRAHDKEIRKAVTAGGVVDADQNGQITPIPTPTLNCSNLGCLNTTPTKGKKGDGWKKCPGKGCRVWSCGDLACVEGRERHSQHCKKLLK